jgi:hypothetical protein
MPRIKKNISGDSSRRRPFIYLAQKNIRIFDQPVINLALKLALLRLMVLLKFPK